jgi:hypothetical protein
MDITKELFWTETHNYQEKKVILLESVFSSDPSLLMAMCPNTVEKETFGPTRELFTIVPRSKCSTTKGPYVKKRKIIYP